MKSINYLGFESNLSIRHHTFFKYCLEVSMITTQWERLGWKTAYSMILSNNTKWVSGQLFGTLGPLGTGYLHTLIFITELLLVWPVGHMDLIEKIGPLNQAQVSWNGYLPTWMWHLNLEPFLILSIIFDKVPEEWGEISEELLNEGGSFWNNIDMFFHMFFSHHLNWNLLSFLPNLSHFDLEHNSYKQIIKVRLLRLWKF